MAQKTGWAAATLTEPDINTYLMHEGGAWSAWTPTVVQSGAVAVTGRANFGRAGRFIYFDAVLTVTGTGVASNLVTVSIPANNFATTSSHANMGEGYIFDNSTGFYHYGILKRASATTMIFGIRTMGAGDTYLGLTSFTAALASPDVISFHGFYECST